MPIPTSMADQPRTSSSNQSPKQPSINTQTADQQYRACRATSTDQEEKQDVEGSPEFLTSMASGIDAGPIHKIWDFAVSKHPNPLNASEITAIGNTKFRTELVDYEGIVQYAQNDFEGMQACKTPNESIVPLILVENAHRSAKLARRLSIEAVPRTLFTLAIKALVRVDGAWISEYERGTLCIRPFLFGTEVFLCLWRLKSFTSYVIARPCGQHVKKDDETSTSKRGPMTRNLGEELVGSKNGKPSGLESWRHFVCLDAGALTLLTPTSIQTADKIIQQLGLLFVWTNVDPLHEAEFNDWYCNEHLAECVNIPGMRSATRYGNITKNGQRYLSLYYAETLDVFYSDAYQSILLHQTPRSVTNLAHMRNPLRRIFEVHSVRGSGRGRGDYLVVVRQGKEATEASIAELDSLAEYFKTLDIGAVLISQVLVPDVALSTSLQIEADEDRVLDPILLVEMTSQKAANQVVRIARETLPDGEVAVLSIMVHLGH